MSSVEGARRAAMEKYEKMQAERMKAREEQARAKEAPQEVAVLDATQAAQDLVTRFVNEIYVNIMERAEALANRNNDIEIDVNHVIMTIQQGYAHIFQQIYSVDRIIEMEIALQEFGWEPFDPRD